MILNWKVTKGELTLIHDIAQRARGLALELGHDISTTDFEMDVIATHANGCPLRLSELASADKFNFAHDVFGIRRHINRENGQLENCFVPRFAAPERNEARNA